MTADPLLMHPALQEHWRQLQPLALKVLGVRVELDMTQRTRAQQAALYAQGRTAPGGIVTNAGPGQSPHNDSPSSAYDFHVLSSAGKPTWADNEPYWAVAGLAWQLGASPGALWTGAFVDLPHVELPGWVVGRKPYPLGYRLTPRGAPMITPELLRRIVPSLDSATAALSGPKLDAAATRYGINTPQRVAHWLAQLAHESGFRPAVENLYYTAAGLMATWPGRFPTTTSAAPYVMNPQMLANYVYAGRLGNMQVGDGFLFRGRGFLQLTGRANYQSYSRLTSLDLLNNPDWAAQYGAGALIAGAFWQTHGLSGLADRGGLAQVEAVTRVVNGGTNGLSQRQGYYRVAAAALGASL